MKSRVGSLMAWVALAMTGLVDGCDRAPEPAGQALFNGSTLAGWMQPTAGSWTVVGGEITAVESAGNTMLVSRATYDNYSLSLEFWVDTQANSGVFIRCADPEEISPFACYEVNIWDDHPNQEFRTGAIVAQGAPSAIVETAGRWNRMVIEANGNRLQVRVNGTVTADVTDNAHTEGHIALQRFNDGRVRFRNIVLTPTGTPGNSE